MAGGRLGRPPGRSRGSGRPRGTGRRPGRPRKDSDSTVASVDLSNIEFVPELSILKPVASQNDFPTFVLDDAVVYRKDTSGKLVVANVCNVNLEGPLVVRGKLEVEDEHKPHLRKPSRNSAHIEVPVCEGYSIGYGPWPAVWASGKAGWYEINPSKEYRAMYEHMCEGITLYYKILDAYDSIAERTPKGKRYKAWQTPIEKVMFKYSVAIGDGATLLDVQRRCQKHAPFLLAHFEQEGEFNWKPTSFRKWLFATNEELVKRLEEVKKKLPAPASVSTEMPAAETAHLKEESNDSTHDLPLQTSVVTDRSRRSKSRTNRQSADNDAPMEDVPPRRSETYIPPPVIPPHRHAQPAVPSTPATKAQHLPLQAEEQESLRLLLEVLEEILEAHGGHAQSLGHGKLHSELYMRMSIKQYIAAREITHFYVKSLLEELPQKWNPSPFWEWLTKVAEKPFEPTLLTKDQLMQVRRRRKKEKSSSNPKGDREDERTAPRGAGKRWPPSNLTPRTGILAPRSAKRPAVYYSDDDDERARKAARKSQDSEENSEDEDEDADDDDTSDDAEIPASTNPALDTPTPAPPLETTRLVVRAERIPSMSPSGPNGTWRCEEDSCNYIVRSAEEPEGKDLIAKHFQEHASRAEKMDLALTEGTRGHLPINHLLEKIRSMGEKAQNKEQSRADDVSAPLPVKRKLII